jgi:hypothetical protein
VVEAAAAAAVDCWHATKARSQSCSFGTTSRVPRCNLLLLAFGCLGLSVQVLRQSLSMIQCCIAVQRVGCCLARILPYTLLLSPVAVRILI